MGLDDCKHDQLTNLKQKFSMVFEDPSDLPPLRGVFYHTITSGSGPVSIRPYKYIPLEKKGCD